MFERHFLAALASGTCAFFASGSLAQEFDAAAFERAVNEALADVPGVTFSTDGAEGAASNLMSGLVDATNEWAIQSIRTAPDFGFVIYDDKGDAWDILGGNAPYEAQGNSIDITGYQLPEGYTVGTVGRAQYIEAVTDIAQSRVLQAPSDDIAKAVQTVKNASGYLKQELCTTQGRPTEIVLNLTAGFKLAFNLETGSQFTWDLEVVCAR
ncbi:MAG: hypothetical protein AAGF50_02170 [Pseudomonadota bacterium]